MVKVYKAYAKVNIFLKITGKRDDYHEIISRFMKVNSLYDELTFFVKDYTEELQEDFLIKGDFSCKTEQNTIYKAYVALQKVVNSDMLELFFDTHGIRVSKNIPAFAGLGGGSSDAATFLHMCNDFMTLGLGLDELATIGLEVGADVPFFIYGYESANVSGIGEIVEKFDEERLDFEVFTPNIEISTPKVYQSYSLNFYNPIDEDEADALKRTKSREVLENFDAYEANDLFKPAMKEYQELAEYYDDSWHFSGSGSSFFKLKQ